MYAPRSGWGSGWGVGVCITERSRAPISENCKVRGIGVAVMVRVSTLTFIWRSFSFTLTPNFCSSSIISSPKSLNLMLLPIILCVPIRILILPSPKFLSRCGNCLWHYEPDSDNPLYTENPSIVHGKSESADKPIR